MIKNISLEIMNSTKLHHHYFDELLQFPEIYGNCSMTRKKGSTNKLVHIKTRNSLDIQKICNEGRMMDGTRPPEFWILRLIEISGNPPYIIDTGGLGITAKQFILSDYITPDLEIKAGVPEGFIFEKPVQRNNDTMKYDIEYFARNVLRFYLQHWDDQIANDHIKIRGRLIDLQRMAARGWNNIREGYFQRLFLLNDGKSKNFKPIQSDIKFHKDADLILYDKWHSSWSDFWEVMSKSIDELAEQFMEPKFYFKLKNGKRKANFNEWLQEGLLNYLEPTNPKIESDDLDISHLKFLILSKADRKK